MTFFVMELFLNLGNSSFIKELFLRLPMFVSESERNSPGDSKSMGEQFQQINCLPNSKLFNPT